MLAGKMFDILSASLSLFEQESAFNSIFHPTAPLALCGESSSSLPGDCNGTTTADRVEPGWIALNLKTHRKRCPLANIMSF